MGVLDPSESVFKTYLNNIVFIYETEVLKSDFPEMPLHHRAWILFVLILENTTKVIGFGLMTAFYNPYSVIGYLIAIFLIYGAYGGRINGLIRQFFYNREVNKVQYYLRKIYLFRVNLFILSL